MKKGFHLRPGLILLAAACLAAAGCDEEGAVRVDYAAVGVAYADDECCPPLETYWVQVAVGCPGGCVIPGATVELVAASVPEATYMAVADAYGIAWFEIAAAPDVTLVAYACADGYVCEAADIATGYAADPIALSIVLWPAY